MIKIYVLWLFMCCFLNCVFAEEKDQRLTELDAYWAEVSRTVKVGDFKGYAATCHPDGVLISGQKKTSYLLTAALEKWKPGFLKTAAGEVKAEVEFKFSQRWGDSNTAHEIGMFRYSGTDETGETKTVYVHLEALLVKKERWLITMEFQKSTGTREEWEKL